MSVELIGGVCNDLKKMLTMLNGNTHNNISKTDHGNDDKHRKTIKTNNRDEDLFLNRAYYLI